MSVKEYLDEHFAEIAIEMFKNTEDGLTYHINNVAEATKVSYTYAEMIIRRKQPLGLREDSKGREIQKYLNSYVTKVCRIQEEKITKLKLKL